MSLRSHGGDTIGLKMIQMIYSRSKYFDREVRVIDNNPALCGQPIKLAPPAPPENTELVISGRVKRSVLEEYNQVKKYKYLLNNTTR